MQRNCLFIIVAIVIILSSSSSTGVCQDTASQDRIRRLYEEAGRLVDKGIYDEAVKKYEEAIVIADDPDIKKFLENARKYAEEKLLKEPGMTKEILLRRNLQKKAYKQEVKKDDLVQAELKAKQEEEKRFEAEQRAELEGIKRKTAEEKAKMEEEKRKLAEERAELEKELRRESGQQVKLLEQNPESEWNALVENLKSKKELDKQKESEETAKKENKFKIKLAAEQTRIEEEKQAGLEKERRIISERERKLKEEKQDKEFEVEQKLQELKAESSIEAAKRREKELKLKEIIDRRYKKSRQEEDTTGKDIVSIVDEAESALDDISGFEEELEALKQTEPAPGGNNYIIGK